MAKKIKVKAPLTEEEEWLLYRLGAAIQNSGDPDATLVVYASDDEWDHILPLIDAGLASVTAQGEYPAVGAWAELRISDKGAEFYLGN